MDSEVTLDYMKTFEHDKMIYEKCTELLKQLRQGLNKI